MLAYFNNSCYSLVQRISQSSVLASRGGEKLEKPGVCFGEAQLSFREAICLR